MSANGARRQLVVGGVALFVTGALVGAAAIGLATRSAVGDLRRMVGAEATARASADAAAVTSQESTADQLTSLASQTRALGDANKAASERTPEAVAQRALKSVYTVETDYATGSSFVWRAGSGGAASLLITNAHVLEGMSTGSTVTLHQAKRTYEATILEMNSTIDLALLSATVPGAALAAGSTPKQGSTVIAIGAPFGLDGTVTTGVLSAVRDRDLQFSAQISPGNSGGALVDLSGRVIGVPTAKIVTSGAEGLGLAIPIGRVCGALRHACET